MINQLQSIKEQLFDAPIEVKESFNNIVKYFNSKSRSYDGTGADTEYWIEMFKFINNPNSSKNGPRIVTSSGWMNRYSSKPAKPRKGLKFTGFPLQEFEIIEGPFKTKEEAQKKLDLIKK